MPTFWAIPRKNDVWAVVTGRGPHSSTKSIPIGVAIRDKLGLVSSLPEAKRILNEGKVLINGVCRKEYSFPIGAMDVLEMPETKTTYRVMPSHGGFEFKETKDSSILSKITNKVSVKAGKIQYTTHNGLTLVADNKYKIGDTLKLDAKKKITGHIALVEGSQAIVTEGKLRGTEGKISKVGGRITLEAKDGKVETIKDYIFVTGAK